MEAKQQGTHFYVLTAASGHRQQCTVIGLYTKHGLIEKLSSDISNNPSGSYFIYILEPNETRTDFHNSDTYFGYDLKEDGYTKNQTIFRMSELVRSIDSQNEVIIADSPSEILFGPLMDSLMLDWGYAPNGRDYVVTVSNEMLALLKQNCCLKILQVTPLSRDIRGRWSYYP